MLARVIDSLDSTAPELTTLRSLSYGGARMPAAVIAEALRLFPTVEFTNAYGPHRDQLHDLGTRARRTSSGMFGVRIPECERACSRPVFRFPGIEIEIRDAGRRRPACRRELGDVFVRREKQVAGEYLGADAADTGWFATRDRGYLDDAGYLFIEGRSDDTIIPRR